jgi:RHS repeat-associated protein
MTTPDGRTISYAYNAVNRLTEILSSSSLGPLNFSFSYDSSGRRTELIYPNGVTTTYSYNPSSYLTTLSAQKLRENPVNSFSYSHDKMGSRISMTDLAGEHNYTYDNIYQLTQATHPNMPTEQFGYDVVGNRISAEGETVGAHVPTIYTYDWENRLIKVEYPGMVAQYKYDPFGRRIEKSVNGDITRYVYDGPNIVVEYDGDGKEKNAYIQNLAIDDPLAIQQGTNTYYYHKDGLGSVVNLTDSTGSVVNSYTYKSFGEIYSQPSTIQQPFTFTGREFDPESALYYYRARYYDPKTGRFWSKDPLGFSGGDANLFRYVQNNPFYLVDALGLWSPAAHDFIFRPISCIKNRNKNALKR